MVLRRRLRHLPGGWSLDRSVHRRQRCPGCGRRYGLVTSFVLRDGDAYAIARTALHDHDGPEAWIDATFGTVWADPDDEADDRVTFGCRFGAIEGVPEPAATLVEGARTYDDSATWGRKLTRDEALVHPRLAEYWEVVDLLLEHERAIRRHLTR